MKAKIDKNGRLYIKRGTKQEWVETICLYTSDCLCSHYCPEFCEFAPGEIPIGADNCFSSFIPVVRTCRGSIHIVEVDER